MRWLDQDDDYPDEFRALILGTTNERMSFGVRSITSETDKKNTAFTQLCVLVLPL